MKPNGLNHFYYSGQVFDLDQKTMNEMIADVHALQAYLDQARAEIEDWKGRYGRSLELAEIERSHRIKVQGELRLLQHFFDRVK